MELTEAIATLEEAASQIVKVREWLEEDRYAPVNGEPRARIIQSTFDADRRLTDCLYMLKAAVYDKQQQDSISGD